MHVRGFSVCVLSVNLPPMFPRSHILSPLIHGSCISAIARSVTVWLRWRFVWMIWMVLGVGIAGGVEFRIKLINRIVSLPPFRASCLVLGRMRAAAVTSVGLNPSQIS